MSCGAWEEAVVIRTGFAAPLSSCPAAAISSGRAWNTALFASEPLGRASTFRSCRSPSSRASENGLNSLAMRKTLSTDPGLYALSAKFCSRPGAGRSLGGVSLLGFIHSSEDTRELGARPMKPCPFRAAMMPAMNFPRPAVKSAM